MSLENLENFSVATNYYSLKDKAFNYAQNVRFKAYDRIDAIRNSIETKQDFDAYHKNIKENFKLAMGDLPYDKNCPLNSKVTKVFYQDGLEIRNVIFSSRENVYVTANLYLPEKRDKKLPAVLLQCGHSGNGKASENYQKAAKFIASKGMVVLVTDPVGQGERNQYVSDTGEAIINPAVPNHQQFGNQSFLIGVSPVKYFLADAIKSVDYLQSLDEVDSSKIGATGISGGGTMTSLLMAYDDRIKAAAPGCWPCSGREYFLVGTAPDSEQNWPEILNYNIDVFEIMAAFCPKPLMLLTAKYDFLPFEGVKKLYDETSRLYEIAGVKNNSAIAIADEMHGYTYPLAKSAAEFFQKHLCGTESFEDKEFIVNEDSVLYCTKSGNVALDIKDSLTIFDENLIKYGKILENKPTDQEKEKFFKERIYYNRPENFEVYLRKITGKWYTFAEDGIWIEPYVWLTHENMPCYGIVLKKEENKDKNLPITLCLWSGGTDKLAENSSKINEILNSGRAAFIIDLTAMGKCAPFNMRSGTDVNAPISSMTDKIAKSLFLTGDSLCALRAYDLITSLKMIRKEFTTDIELYTTGKYCIFGRIVEILDKDVLLTFENETKVSDIIKNKYYDNYDIPQIIMPNIGNLID